MFNYNFNFKFQFQLHVRKHRLRRLVDALVAHGDGAVRSVNLGYAEMDDDGACMLAEFLGSKAARGVKEVRLDGNSIGDRGAKAIANALKVSNPLFCFFFFLCLCFVVTFDDALFFGVCVCVNEFLLVDCC